jgi:hypothetical protein
VALLPEIANVQRRSSSVRAPVQWARQMKR